ncbi:hypothetical protein D3C81_1373930 [compost metagenome]
MDYTKHQLNEEESKRVYEACKAYMENKMCYHNIFHAVCRFPREIASGEWKITYGYMTSIRNIMVRHCFLVNRQGEVIDPTMYTHERLLDTLPEYVPFYRFINYERYMAAIEANENYPDLWNHPQVRRHDKHFEESQWVKDNGVFLLR